jgi:hypothetical protein
MTSAAMSCNCTWLPEELLVCIIDYIHLKVPTLLRLSHINQQMYSVAEKYWIKLWENAYPQSKLLKNHRFACLQLFQYNLKHRPLRILVTGKSNIGKTDLLLQFTRQKRLSDFEVYHVQPYVLFIKLTLVTTSTKRKYK